MTDNNAPKEELNITYCIIISIFLNNSSALPSKNENKTFPSTNSFI